MRKYNDSLILSFIFFLACNSNTQRVNYDDLEKLDFSGISCEVELDTEVKIGYNTIGPEILMKSLNDSTGGSFECKNSSVLSATSSVLLFHSLLIIQVVK